MQLGRAFGNGGTGDLDTFLDRMCVCVFLPCPAIEPAKFTIRNADVRVVKVPVDVVIRRQPMLAPANGVGELAESIQVGRVVERNALFKCKAFAVLDLECDVDQITIKRKLHNFHFGIS